MKNNEAELHKRIVELEAQLEQSQEEHVELKSKEERSLHKYHKLNEKLVSEEKLWKDKCLKAEVDKRKIAVDLKLSTTKLKESDAELHRLNCLVDERDAAIKASILKIGALEKLNSEVAMHHRENRLADNRRVEENITELLLKNEALTEEKAELESRSADNQKLEEMISELHRQIEVLEEREAELESRSADNRELEEIISELRRQIEVLEEGKVEREAEMRKLEGRLTDNRKSKEKIAELQRKIQVLEKGRTVMDLKIHDGDERVVGLRGALEEEKKRTGKAMERMKVLEKIEKVDSEVERAKNKRKVLELSSTFEAKNVGKDREFMEKVGLPAMNWEQNEEMRGLNPAKSVVAAPRIQVGTEVLRSSADKEIPNKKKQWENASDMCDAFARDDKLCMQSVCTLYQKHKCLGSWKNCASNNSAFKPVHEAMGITLGEILTNKDPEGRMKISVAKFKRANPLDMEECRIIARSHSTVLFELFNNGSLPYV